jgi:methyl-accepting chemotaxis protein
MSTNIEENEGKVTDSSDNIVNEETLKSTRPAKTGFVMRALGNTPIGLRIAVLAGIGVLGVAAVGTMQTALRADLDRNAATVAEYIDLKELDDALRIDALQMRRSEKDFLIRKAQKYRGKYLKAAEQGQVALAKMKNSPVAAPVGEALDALAAGLTTHVAQFEKVFGHQKSLGFNEKSGLQGELRAAVHNVETRLKTAGLSDLTVKMLMMRRHEKDFMLRGAEKYIGRIDKRQAEFRALLAASALAPAEQTAISGMLDLYVAKFNAFAAESLLLKAETKKLSTIFAGMAPHFKIVDDFAISERSAAEARAVALKDKLEGLMIGIAFAILALVLAAGFVIARSVSVPLRRFSGVVAELAEGDLTVEIPYSTQKDEIGEMARTVGIFKQNLIETGALRQKQIEAERQTAEEERRRDAEQRKAQEKAAADKRTADEKAEADRKQTMLQMADEFEKNVMGVVSSVASATEEMRSSAERMSATAEKTSQQTTSVAAGAGQATANVQTVAAATEELSSSVEEISRQVSHSNEIAQNAVASAKQTNEKVEGLAEGAQKIGDVVSLINDIASQTNLLALNATIEAARAGEAGKGFAVVATEVKSLADQTARATEEIAAQVSAIQSATNDAVEAIKGIGGTITEIGEIAASVVSAVEQQGDATREIASNIQQAATGTQEVADTISQVTSAADESKAVSAEMLDAANSLGQQGDTLRVEVQKFLDSVRAA